MKTEVKSSQVEKYLQDAELMLEKKDLIGFAESIGKARLRAEEAESYLPEVLYRRARGLYLLREYEVAMNAIIEALTCNEGEKWIRLQKYKGLILGYYGRFEEGIKVFKELLTKTEDAVLLAEIQINMSWLCLVNYRIEAQEELLNDAKYYLDLVNQRFDELDDHFKWQITMNYGEYFSQKKEHSAAIEKLEMAQRFCQAKDLPIVYNNLAELHLVLNEMDIAQDYLHKAEVMGNKYGNYLEVAKALFTHGLAEMRIGDEVKALDAFSSAFQYFKSAQAYNYAFDCFSKILEVTQGLRANCLVALKEGVRKDFKNTGFYEQLGGN